MTEWLLSFVVGALVCIAVGILTLAVLYTALAVRLVIRAIQGHARVRGGTRC